MKKYTFLFIALFMFLFFGFNTNSADALVLGCTATSNYSVITGQSCKESESNVVPGCLPSYNFSPLTGQACNNSSSNNNLTVSSDSSSTSSSTSSDSNTAVRIDTNKSSGEVEIAEIPGNKSVSCLLPQNLKKGDREDSVYLLQKALDDTGYYPEGLITGYYGRLTQRAVNRFKKANPNKSLNSVVKEAYR